MEAEMKVSIALAALLITGLVTASTQKASAVVYCQYVGYPTGCVARAGVVLRPQPVGGAVEREAVGLGTPMNRGGAVEREAVRPGTPMNRGGPDNRVRRR